jgi:acyl-CoA reductase-like NAD-dependent aldehyde dehydrogenase
LIDTRPLIRGEQVEGEEAALDVENPTFGPVAPIVPVRSLDEAIELANATRFGLEAIQETKHVHLETQIGIKDWWFPYGGGPQAKGA